jgi:hypothetical protein
MIEEPKTIPLDGVRPAHGIEFIRSEWWGSRFALIFTRDLSGAEKSLRMDMNKRSFIDHYNDKEADVEIQARAEDIWKIIAGAINRISSRAPVPS